MASKQSSGQGWSLASDSPKQSTAARKNQPENRWKIFVEKRPGGRVVTVVKNAAQGTVDHQKLLKTLQGLCGAGGALREGGFELQGDHRQIVEKILPSIWNLDRD